MIRAAIWIDADTEFFCAFVALPDHDIRATGSNQQILVAAIEYELSRSLPEFIDYEVGYLFLGVVRRPVSGEWLRTRLQSAMVTA